MKLFIFIILVSFTFFGFYKERDIFRIKEVDVSLMKENRVSYKFDFKGINKAENKTNSALAKSDAKLEIYWQKQLVGLKNQLAFIQNEFIWNAPLNKISDIVSEYNWIQNFKIIRHWPHRIEVKVQVREPQILFVNNDGLIQPVDSEGIILPLINFAEAPALPFLRGQIFLKQNVLRKKAVEFLNLLPQDGHFTKDKISDVSYQENDGFVLTLIWKSLKIKLGYEPSTLVGLRVNQVLEYLQNRNIDGRVIDANFSKKVLVKLQNHP